MHEAETLKSPDDEQTRRAKARVGQTVRGRWHLDSLLGIGGMASVYAATHRNGKRVAVKMLHPELSASPEMKQRFIDEGYAANTVGHPAAVSVLDDDESDDGAVFFVMDLLEGESLESRIRRRAKLDPDELLLVIDVLLDVLAAAHDKGIVHRDVKPDNIFITVEGKVKLLDFGIARVIEPGRPRTTQSGATMGTPAFMPPEQARGRWEQIDGRSDLWAVGATMFVALTGRQVHEGETVNEELLSAMTVPAPSLRDLAPSLPAPLIELVDRALAFEQEERWSDARTMQAAARTVQALLDDLPVQKRNDDGSSPSLPPVDSARPVTLLTPHPIVASTLRTIPAPGSKPTPRRPILFGALAAAALFLVSLAIMTTRTRGTATNAPVPTTVSAAQGASPEPTASRPDPASIPATAPLAAPVDDSPPGSVAKTKTEALRPPKPNRPAPTIAAASAQPAKGPQPASVAPPPELPLPSTADPLDRRK